MFPQHGQLHSFVNHEVYPPPTVWAVKRDIFCGCGIRFVTWNWGWGYLPPPALAHVSYPSWWLWYNKSFFGNDCLFVGEMTSWSGGNGHFIFGKSALSLLKQDADLTVAVNWTEIYSTVNFVCSPSCTNFVYLKAFTAKRERTFTWFLKHHLFHCIKDGASIQLSCLGVVTGGGGGHPDPAGMCTDWSETILMKKSTVSTFFFCSSVFAEAVWRARRGLRDPRLLQGIERDGPIAWYVTNFANMSYFSSFTRPRNWSSTSTTISAN